VAPPPALVCARLVALAGCGGTSVLVPEQGTLAPDSLMPASITPAQGTVLILDDPISFSVTTGYLLNSAASGRIRLAVQDEIGRILRGGTPPSVVVQRGSASATLTDRVNLSARGITRGDVVVSLLPDGAAAASARVTVSYSVR
jgi:hypothetical protein